MAFIPVPSTVQVEMVFDYNGEICENVYNCNFQVAYDGVAIANLLDVFRNWWNTNMRVSRPGTLSLVNLIGTDQASIVGPRVEDGTGLPLTGGGSGPSLPNHVSLAVKWTTPFRGRSFRGRTFHIGLQESQVVGNTVEDLEVAFLTTTYAQLLTDLATFGAPLAVVSRQYNGAPRTTGIATLVTGVYIDGTVDSQRRRLPGRGR